MPLSANSWPNLPPALRTKRHGLVWQSDGNDALNCLSAEP
jgi:hypothetical protein